VSPQVVIVGHDPDVPNVEIRSNFIPVVPFFLAPPITGAVPGIARDCVAGGSLAVAPPNDHATGRVFPAFPTNPALSIGSLYSPARPVAAGIPIVVCHQASRMRGATPHRH
jgi:hypothetical protein